MIPNSEVIKLQKLRTFTKKHPDISAVIFIGLLFLAMTGLIMVINCNGFTWGSDRDWKNQHFAIPEYFRMRFYETRDPFPDFALQIGGGQNIYNYSYYGIANPLYLPAYAIPFVKMSTYIQILCLITVLISSIMSYYLYKGHFRRKTALILALMFMGSGGLFYHSHHHIMFMNYFPFLLGMLLCCRRKKSSQNLLIMAALSYCIMCTSFYFSVGCFASVFIYMIYLELQGKKRFSPIQLIKNNFLKIIGAALGCLCSSFMWLPTLMAIISGREKTAVDIQLSDIMMPRVNLNTLLYSGYSMGLTVFVLFAAIYLIFKGKAQSRFLSLLLVFCAIIPAINYTVNAFMYIDGKSFMPLCTVMLLIPGHFFSEKQLSMRYIFISTVLVFFMGILNIIFSDYNVELQLICIPILIFSMITPTVIILSCHCCKNNIIPIYATVGSLVICLVNNCCDTFVTKDQIRNFYDKDTENAIISTIDKDSGVYRFANTVHNEVNVNHIFSMGYLSTSSYSSVNNPSLREFRFNTSLSENRVRNTAIQNQPYNIVFNTLMGCRYRLSSEKMMMYGEKKVADLGDSSIYSNNYAFPLGYASSDVMGEDAFLALPSHLKAEAMLKNIIIPGTDTTDTTYVTEQIFPDISPLEKDPNITAENGVFTIKSTQNFTVNIDLQSPVENKIIIVTATADNSIGNPLKYSDVFLIINGVKNKLTDPRWKYNNHNYNFSYVLSSASPVDRLEMTFSPGFYTLADLRVYTMDVSVLDNAMQNKDTLVIDQRVSFGDSITGVIKVSKDNSWFNMSLPYDKNFNITVDGNPTEYFRTNTAFIGFPISSGTHTIIVEFIAPLKKTGMKISLISAIILILLSIFAKLRKNK